MFAEEEEDIIIIFTRAYAVLGKCNNNFLVMP